MQLGDIRTILIQHKPGERMQIKLSEGYKGLRVQAEPVYMDENAYKAAIGKHDLWPCKLRESNEHSPRHSDAHPTAQIHLINRTHHHQTNPVQPEVENTVKTETKNHSILP